MFASYNFAPGMGPGGHRGLYEDSLDKLRKSYDIDLRL